MRVGSKILELKYKLMTIERLNLAKSYYTYRELSQLIGLPDTVLSRYVKGHVLPTFKRAEAMNKALQKVIRLDGELQERVKFDEYGFFDNTKIIGDTRLLERVVQHGFNRFAGERVTKILTAAVDGIPLATLLAHRLGVGLVIAKKKREVGVKEYLVEVLVPLEAATIVSFFVPRGALGRRDRVLIVDDVIDSGETQEVLIKLVERARAEVIGIYGLVAIGEEWKEKLEQATRGSIEMVLQVSKRHASS